MKTLKYLLSSFLTLLLLFGCDNEDDNFDYLNSLKAPWDVSAIFQVAQDNSGLVTIIPNATGAVNYKITLGDGTAEAISVKQGEQIEHTYAEGNYSVGIEAIGITGLTNVVSKDLVVSFKAPENLEITA
jgi:hypothetical protein